MSTAEQLLSDRPIEFSNQVPAPQQVARLRRACGK